MTRRERALTARATATTRSSRAGVAPREQAGRREPEQQRHRGKMVRRAFKDA